jgi:hypothetical protein
VAVAERRKGRSGNEAHFNTSAEWVAQFSNPPRRVNGGNSSGLGKWQRLAFFRSVLATASFRHENNYGNLLALHPPGAERGELQRLP